MPRAPHPAGCPAERRRTPHAARRRSRAPADRWRIPCPWSRPQANSRGPALRSQLCATSDASALESPSALLTWTKPAARARSAVASPTANSGRWRWLTGSAAIALPLVARMACTLAEGGNVACNVLISQERRDDRPIAQRGDPRSGFAGARFRPGDQDAGGGVRQRCRAGCRRAGRHPVRCRCARHRSRRHAGCASAGTSHRCGRPAR